MTLDEIITALKSTNAVPTAALAAADNGNGPDWDSPERALPRRELRRSTKIGCNATFPFDSDKKFKKCCGSGTAPLAH